MTEQTSTQLHTANYSGGFQPKYSGFEHLSVGSQALPFHMIEFWQWAYSDMIRNTQRGVFAEFIVKTALDLGGIRVNQDIRCSFEPFDLLGPNITVKASQLPPPELENSSTVTRPCRIEVKCASYVQAWGRRHDGPPSISFSIAPARVPDETGDYKRDAPCQRNSDLYIFCVYTATKKEQNVLDMNLWEFYVVKTSVLDKECSAQKTLNLRKLCTFGIQPVPYSELCNAITTACKEISSDCINKS